MEQERIIEVTHLCGDKIANTHPIFPDFLEKFSKRIEEGPLSLSTYFTWFLYWFANQRRYTKVKLINIKWVTTAFDRINILRKEEGKIVVEKNYNMTYSIPDNPSYDSIKENYDRIFEQFGGDSVMVFTNSYANSFLNCSKFSPDSQLSSILSHYLGGQDYICTTITSVNGKENPVYDDSIVCSEFEFSSFQMANYHYKYSGHSIITDKNFSEFSRLLGLVIQNSLNQKDSKLLNQWHTRGEVMFYLTKITGIFIHNLFSFDFKIKGYWCFKWVYDLVITPHLYAYESLSEGRWSETQFRSYLLNNFALEANTLEELKEKAKELLYTPVWIEAFDIKKLKEFV